MTTIQQQAEQFAAHFDNDGQRWETRDGISFDDVMTAMNADVEYARRVDGPDDDGRCTWEVCWRGEHEADAPVRYVFPDGSVIVGMGGGWDFEGSRPFSWKGTE